MESEVKNEAMAKVYPLIVQYIIDHQRAPALLHIARQCGFSSTSVTRDRVNELVWMGWVERSERGYISVPGLKLAAGAAVEERLAEAEALKAQLVQAEAQAERVANYRAEVMAAL